MSADRFTTINSRPTTTASRSTRVIRRRVLGLYAQDEITLQPWLLLNAGVRLDYDRAFGANVAPRAGLVFLPGPNSSLKILHGGAFRAPNSYELYYSSAMEEYGFRLEPETIKTTEVVWEGTIGSHLRAAVSAFHYDADQLVEPRTIATIAADGAADGGLYFVNAGRTTANGADAELEALLGERSRRQCRLRLRARDGSGHRRYALQLAPAHDEHPFPCAARVNRIHAGARGARRQRAFEYRRQRQCLASSPAT